MADRYPGYDVLAKRDSMSWNDQTRTVIDARVAIDPNRHRWASDAEWATLKAVCDRIVPQPTDRAPVPLAAMIDADLAEGSGDGYRHASLPPKGESWRRVLAALDAEAQAQHGRAFHRLAGAEQDGLLTAVQQGYAAHAAWAGATPQLLFRNRIVHDIVSAYYAHPLAWNEIGYGGPASPRGYVRLGLNRRDPWEAAEARPGAEAEARTANRHAGRV